MDLLSERGTAEIEVLSISYRLNEGADEAGEFFRAVAEVPTERGLMHMVVYADTQEDAYLSMDGVVRTFTRCTGPIDFEETDDAIPY